MKTVLFFIIVTASILTYTLAFADIISYTAHTSFSLASMVGLGFGLLGLAKIGRKII